MIAIAPCRINDIAREAVMADFPYASAHFIGIGGVGMSATALMLRDCGVRVTGSDEAVYPPISEVLASERLDVRTPYAAGNIPTDVDLVVIGKNAKLVPQTNAEVAEAFRRGCAILSFADVLGILAKSRNAVVVAGSFGKTTSVSLMAHCLLSAGLDPSYMIGAVPLSPSRASHVGRDPLILLEGDEYPSSNTDDRSKFLHYSPAHVLLTPLAHDHVNVFPTVESYLAPFQQLIDMVPPEGTILASTGGELSGRFLASLTRDVTTYGIDSGEWQARDIAWGDRTSFTLTHQGRDVVRVETGQLGLHNIENMVGVGAFVLSRGLVSPTAFAQAMAAFRGIRRRLDRKSDLTTLPIFEGFGSSYDKARSAIAAMRQHFPGNRLVVVFEPHTFSWRNRATLHWYDDVFAGCDEVLVYEPASQGASTHEQVTQGEIVARIRAGGFSTHPVASCQEGIAMLRTMLRANDAVLLLTSGNLGGLIEAIPALAEELFPLETLQVA
jgi:UDP-N-acetylmuramate: L-alanyl-gamma-D-glutamyl-meso-diaminopimelate ligase